MGVAWNGTTLWVTGVALTALSCSTKAASSRVAQSRPVYTASLAALAASASAQPVPVGPAASATTPSDPAPALAEASDAASAARAPEPPGSTVGTIACGSARCTAGTQTCRLGASPICVDAATNPDGGGLYCDDASDCKAGLTCCQTGASSELVQLCTPRKGPDSSCAVEVCEPTGAPCPKREHCEQQACRPDRQVTCPTSAVACAKNQYCEWQAGASRCVDQPLEPDSAGEGYAAFACTRPADCGPGNQCCSGGMSGWHATYCAVNCDLTNTMTICMSVRECQRSLELIPAALRHKAKLACTPVGDGAPPWLKSCRVDID